MVPPKLFVSYSWSTPDHEAWVLRLATDLRESGVDVILDKWDLKKGHDAHAFMEKMVSDPQIKKVILICDKVYVDKADGRTGGVGTEAQIISGEIYSKQEQDKFVAIVVERDVNGKALLPVYYSSRIYIDFSDSSEFSKSFEDLLRWAYDKPLFLKPDLGQIPKFLSVEAEGGVTLATSFTLKRALEGIRSHREHAIPAMVEYFNQLVEGLEKFRIERNSTAPDDAVVNSVEAFLPYRNNAIEVFVTLAKYIDTLESRTQLHRFFERLLPYVDRPAHLTTFYGWEWDNFLFIVHELFLYAMAVLIREEHFESAAYLLASPYYIPTSESYRPDPTVSFRAFSQPVTSLAQRNGRLNLGRLSLRADLLRERCKGVGIEFRHVVQADFILFLRSHMSSEETGYWFPETLVYDSGPLEVFVRSKSLSYFKRVLVMFGLNTKQEFVAFIEALSASRRIPYWQYQSFSPAHLAGVDKLATLP
jgi:hypothetical protein